MYFFYIKNWKSGEILSLNSKLCFFVLILTISFQEFIIIFIIYKFLKLCIDYYKNLNQKNPNNKVINLFFFSITECYTYNENAQFFNSRSSMREKKQTYLPLDIEKG